MKRVFWFFVLLVVAGTAASASGVEVDAYVDRNYDFASIKSVYIRPSIVEALPESVSLSMPGKVDDWADAAMHSKNMKNALFIKPLKSVWQSMQLLVGDGGFREPFESGASTEFFLSHLTGTCTAVLKLTVSLEAERKWREPAVETYTTTERVHTVERRRNSRGQYEHVDVYTDVPVTKQRTIPGYWYLTASSRCRLDFTDVQNPEPRRIAEAVALGRDTGRENEEKRMLENLMKKTVEKAIAEVFHKQGKR